MKMKKMLAILAALSVLGTTGLTVGAEDAATTEPATETVATTEPTEETTETETTVAETTAVEEETVATEENQTVQEKDTFEAGSKDYQIEQNGTVHNVKVVSQVDYETITTGVVTDAYLVVYVDGTQAGKFSMGSATLHDDYWKDKVSDVDIDNYFSVNGDVMNVTINNKTTAYRYDETSMTLVEANNTTETPADGIFVHGTKTYQMGEHALKVVVYYDSNEGDDLVERMSVYVDGVLSNLSGVAVTSALAGDGTSHEYRANVDNFFAVVDSDTVAVTSYGVTTKYVYTLDNRFVVDNSDDSDVWTFGTKTYQMGEHVVRVVLWGYSGKNNNFDEVEYMSIYVDGKLSNLSKVKVGSVIAGTSDAMEARANVDRYFAISGTNQITVVDRSYKGISTKYTYDAATNTFVATNGTNNGTDNGKIDNGSASNAPASTATKNTSGTPKTGDATTVPAVAVGLTLTAAGVVAFISKRKK